MSFEAAPNPPQSDSLEVMARYFFHTHNGGRRLDGEGVDMPTGRAAQLEATRLLGELLAQKPEDFWRSQALTITVTDAGGRVEFELAASVVIRPTDEDAMPSGRPA